MPIIQRSPTFEDTLSSDYRAVAGYQAAWEKRATHLDSQRDEVRAVLIRTVDTLEIDI